ncbi:MAG TPA: type II toxin-antitoxin system VapC family toxin [Terriglobia bacterium]|nr:type II toxin-antitoxin system VapC family toxin [Terriglobia bacterium]
MTPYADTNFFTRVYLELSESGEAERLLQKARRDEAAPLPLTWLHRIEILNAFQLHVFQARHKGQVFVSPQQAALAYAHFRADAEKREFLRILTPSNADLEERFEELAFRHTARHGFRTYDLLHVASALALQCDTFWSFDAKASKLARLEGLAIR